VLKNRLNVKPEKLTHTCKNKEPQEEDKIEAVNVQKQTGYIFKKTSMLDQ